MLIKKSYKRHKVNVQQILIERIKNLTNIKEYFAVHKVLNNVNPVITFSYEQNGICYVDNVEDLADVIFNLKE